jgi:hypothetical protein
VRQTKYLACLFALALVAGPEPRAGAAPRCYPTERFKVIDDQWVRDTLTNLVWQRQASAATMTWTAAKTYCADAGRRLPTVKELFSLVDLTVAQPHIDQKAFPNTPAEPFWTSSPRAGYCDAGWSVDFHDGLWFVNHESITYRVRCVR